MTKAIRPVVDPQNHDLARFTREVSNRLSQNEAAVETIATNVPDPSNAIPLVESGAGSAGTSLDYARADHVHPAYGGGSSALGIDYTIDCTSQTRDFVTGIGAGTGSGGDNPQTVPFTITANNGTTVPSTLSGGVTITPVSSANASAMTCGSDGLRAAISGGFAGKFADFQLDMVQLGIDRLRPFAIWLLLNRFKVNMTQGSEAGTILRGCFTAGVSTVILYGEHAAWPSGGSLGGYVSGSVKVGATTTYTPEFFPAPYTTDNVKVTRFGAVESELFSMPDVGGAFPTSSSLVSAKRCARASIDPILMAQSSANAKYFPNDDDVLRLSVRADITTVEAAYFAIRIYQGPA